MAEQGGLREQPAERRGAERQPAASQPDLARAVTLAAMPQALLALQATAGNMAVSQLILQRAVLDPMPPDPAMVKLAADQAAEKAKLAADEAAEKARQHKEVDPIIESFPDYVQKQIPYDDRWIFMTMMRGYLGPDPATQQHFTNIVDAHKTIPQARVWLHQTAVDRLKTVNDEVGGVFPYTDNGQDLRGRYHERESKSRMAHPMGYAVDFRPYENPMITDTQLTRLLELVGKGSAHAELGLEPKQRRQLIGKIGSGEPLSPADEAKADALFAQFNTEFDRLSKASETFKNSVDHSQMDQLRSEYFGTFKAHTQILKRTVARLTELEKQKHLSDAEKDEQSSLVTVQEYITKSQAGFRQRVADAIAPWTKAVQEALSVNDAAIRMRAPIVFRNAPTPEQYALMKRAYKQLRDVEKANRDKAKDPAERAQYQQAFLEADHGYKQAVDVGDLVDDRAFLNGLMTRLGDLAFIFGASPDADVKNPALAQIAEKGFFTPDAERPPGMQGPANAKTEGFNRAFILLMLKRGFDLGMSWAGFTDPMHFELVEGVDTLREPGQPEKAAASAQTPATPAAQPAAAGVQRAPLEAGVLHIQRDDSHAPSAPAKSTDLDEKAHEIINAAQAETPGIEERAVNAVSAIINTYFTDKKDMVTLVKYVESEKGLLTTSQGSGKKATGVISVGLPFIKDTRAGFGHFARRVLQVAHELEHIQQYRDGMGGDNKKHVREFLAFYHEGTATEVAHTGRMRPDMRVKLLDEAINNYNAMSEDDQKRYAVQYKDVVDRRANEQKAMDEKAAGHKAGGKKDAESPDAGAP